MRVCAGRMPACLRPMSQIRLERCVGLRQRTVDCHTYLNTNANTFNLASTKTHFCTRLALLTARPSQRQKLAPALHKRPHVALHALCLSAITYDVPTGPAPSPCPCLCPCCCGCGGGCHQHHPLQGLLAGVAAQGAQAAPRQQHAADASRHALHRHCPRHDACTHEQGNAISNQLFMFDCRFGDWATKSLESQT